MLDSMDMGRAVRFDDEEASTVRVLSEKSETRPADDDSEARKTSGPRGGEDSVEMSWYSISCTMLGANVDVDDDSVYSANKSETDESGLGSGPEGGTWGEAIDEEDVEVDENKSWDMGETEGPDAMGIVDDGEELGDWKLSRASGEGSSYFVKSKK